MKDAPALGAALQLGLTQSVLLASLPLLVATTGVPYTAWAWALGATLVLYVVAAPAWGRRIDRHGPARTQRTTARGTAACNLLLLVALALPRPAWALVLVITSRVGYALFASGQFPSSQAAVLHGAEPGRVQAALGRLLATNHLGRLAGPALVAVTAATLYWLPLAGLVLLGAGLVWTTRHLADAPGTPAPAATPAPATRRGLATQVWPALAVAFVVTFSVSALQFTLGSSLGGHFGLGPVQATRLLGQVLMLAAVASLAAHLVLVRTVQGRPGTQALLLSACVVAGGALLVGDFTRTGLFAAVALLALGHGLTSPAYTAWARARSPATTGAVAASLTSVHTLGYAAGILFAGTLAPRLPGSPFMVVAVGAVVQAAGMGVLLSGALSRGRRSVRAVS